MYNFYFWMTKNETEIKLKTLLTPNSLVFHKVKSNSSAMIIKMSFWKIYDF